jgi:octaprenyl-diphosphate synthase
MENPLLSLTEETEKIEKTLKLHFQSDFSYINEITSHILSAGGKRVRPILTLLSANICGSNDRKLHELCIIPEYLHAASLLHDDVIDEGEIRRGKPSAYKIWGNKKTILAGDFLYARSIELATHFGNLKIATEIAKTVLLMSEGELIQLQHKNLGNITSEVYYDIIFRKTATLIIASCKIGAYSATDDSPKIKALENYGNNIGFAFQIIDDLIDYLPENYKTGKIKGKDIKEGKMTLPLILAMERSNTNEKARIQNMLAGNINEDNLHWIFNFINDKGINTEIRDKAFEYIEKACFALEIFPDSKEKTILTEISRFIGARNF